MLYDMNVRTPRPGVKRGTQPTSHLNRAERSNPVIGLNAPAFSKEAARQPELPSGIRKLQEALFRHAERQREKYNLTDRADA